MQGHKICACRRGVRTRACRVETLQEPWRKLLNPKEQPRQGFCRQRRSRQGSVVAHLDARAARITNLSARDPGVEMSLDAARTSAYATPASTFFRALHTLSEQCWGLG